MPVVLTATSATSGDAGWEDTSVIGGSSERIDYGSALLIAQGQPTPCSTGRIQFNADIMTRDREVPFNYDVDYNRTSSEIYVYDDSEQLVATHTGLQFSSLSDIVAWVNANVASSGGAFTQSARIQLYDTVDSSLPTIRKVRGRNGILQRYRDSTSISRFAAHIGGDDEQQLLADMWSDAFGFPFPTAVGTWGSADFKCFWFNTGKDGTQFRAQWDTLTAWTPPSGRYMVDTGAVVSANGKSFSFDAGANVVYAALRPDGLSYAHEAIAGKVFREVGGYQSQGWPTVAGIPIIETGGGQVLWVKPMGQDTFYTSWFDTTSYRLECVGGWERDKGNKLRVVASDGPGWPAGDLMGPIPTTVIMEAALADSRNNRRALGGKERPGDIRFQLRDLTTNRVSALSDWKITWRGRERWMQYQGLARYDKL